MDHEREKRLTAFLGERGLCPEDLGTGDGMNALATGQAIPADVPEWVQIAQVGVWLGHSAGPEIVTPEDLRSAAEYFHRHYEAKNTDLVIDYHHGSDKAERGLVAKAPAGGWVQKMEQRNDGKELWGKVMWVSEAKNEISERKFRYLSPHLQWRQPDPVTGETVPMRVVSVALTNTPFMSDLEGLNSLGADAASDGTDAAQETGVETGDGGGTMSLIQQIAEAAGQEAEDIASRLSLDGTDVEDGDVAAAILNAASGPKTVEVLPEAAANALGLDPGADASDVAGRIINLKAGGAMPRVCQALGLPGDSDADDVVLAIQSLKTDEAANSAQALVDQAVQEKKISPAQKEFYLESAQRDLEATRSALNSLQPVIDNSTGGGDGGGDGTRELTDTEEQARQQMGLSVEEFLDAAEATRAV